MATNKNVRPFRKSIETWNVRQSDGTRQPVVKIAVRDRDGKFHGATNFGVKGSI